jgi:hypothetical protein
MQKINLREHRRDPAYYNRDRDMETALAWNAVKKILEKNAREDLFAYVRSVRLTPKNIAITTHKPLVNEEMGFYQREILDAVNDSVKAVGGVKREKIRLQ